MSSHKKPDLLPWLIGTYFSDPSRQLSLAENEILLEQGQENDRLYLVKEGTLSGYGIRQQGDRYELFMAGKKMFVGVYSFFSGTYISSATVITTEPCRVAYIDQHQQAVSYRGIDSLFEQFMPVVVDNLLQRMRREQELALEKEMALKKLVETEKLASLGQMAAGIAHELNNAISILDRNTQWLQGRLAQSVKEHHPLCYDMFKRGLEQGRRLSSSETRARADDLGAALQIDANQARRLAETGLSLKNIKDLLSRETLPLQRITTYWELGATLKDMNVAAQMASHVVRSVKALAVQQGGKESLLQVNETLQEALILLTSPLRGIEVNLHLADLPPISATRGELVQVWTNLIRNGVEALRQPGQGPKIITIESRKRGHSIEVDIIDTGPGIKKEVLPRIMQPNFTTKEKGLDFGLGLGLTIVARLISKYHGDIQVASRPGKTRFRVILPLR